MSKTESAYFKAARAMSEMSDYVPHKLGAVVVDKHRIISSGYNSNHRVDPIQSRIDTAHFGVACSGKLHSESMALIPLIKRKVDLRSAELYVCRYHKNGCPALARPCDRCMKLIKMCGIKKIHYTTENGFAIEKLIY